MKNIISILTLMAIFLIIGCEEDMPEPSEEFLKKYIDMVGYFSLEEFEEVKDFILENGDRETYSPMRNNNPHYSFPDFDVYLEPEDGSPWGCDPAISDYLGMTIRDKEAFNQCFYLLCVRKGASQFWYSFPEGMEEEKVYLVNYYEENLETYKTNALVCIEKLKAEVINQ